MPSWKAKASERLREASVRRAPGLAGKKTFIQSIINAALGFDMTGHVRARAESQLAHQSHRNRLFIGDKLKVQKAKVLWEPTLRFGRWTQQ